MTTKIGLVRLELLFFVLLALPVIVVAHPDDDMTQTQLTVTRWAAGVQGNDAQAVDAVLSADFGGAVDARKGYLATLDKYPITKVVLRYAEFAIDGEVASVSPVVIYPNRQFRTPVALSIGLRKMNQAWKVASIERIQEVPAALVETSHPQRFIRHDVAVSVRDKDTGQPVYSRVHIRDSDGEYWPPRFHMKVIAKGWREDIGGDVIVGGKTYAYVKPDFIVMLPGGNYVIEVERGPEYTPARIEFEVKEDAIPVLQVEVERWTHMAAQGWYSGDSHVHFLDPQTALVEAQGEDLNVINILGSSGGDLITAVHHFTGAPSVHSTEENIVYITEETRHDVLGHTTLLGLKNLIYPMGWGAPSTGVLGGYDYPPMAHQADKAHANGAHVTWAHFPVPNGELAIDVALDKIDSVEIFVFGDPLDEENRIGPARTWYRLLNTGARLPALGATDKMWNTQISGGIRTYVRVQGSFNYHSWIDGIEAGRTFASSGPMLKFNAGGGGLGDTLDLDSGDTVPFRAEVHFRKPIDRIEIVMNGEVIAKKQNESGATRFSLEGNIRIDKSSWIAARAYSDEVLAIQGELYPPGAPLLAHTSPIYIDVDGQPRTSSEDAQFFVAWCDKTIEWARTEAHYHNEAQREEVIALYERAKQIYLNQIGPL